MQLKNVPFYPHTTMQKTCLMKIKEFGFFVSLLLTNSYSPLRTPRMNYFPTIAFSLICSFCPLLASAQDSTPITVTVETLFRYSQIDGNLPDNFPSKNSHYDKAYQGAWNNGILYTNDFGKQELLTFDRLGHRTANGYAGTSSHGIAFDDAGNLIMRDDGITETPCKLRIYRNSSDEPHDIAFYLLENGITNYISASGDIFSDEGGYVYLFPQSTYAVNIVKIANGHFVETTITEALSARASATGYVIPTDNAPEEFIYQSKQYGYFLYSNGSDCGELPTGSKSNTPPQRNQTVGGAYFSLAGHEMMIHSSGPDYCGGFTIRDITAGCIPIANVPALGSKGIETNTSSASFFDVERIDESAVIVYEYCFGAGYAAYKVSGNDPSGINGTCDRPEFQVVARDNFVEIKSDTRLCNIEIYSTTGCLMLQSDETGNYTSLIDWSALPSGIYVIKAGDNTARAIKR